MFRKERNSAVSGIKKTVIFIARDGNMPFSGDPGIRKTNSGSGIFMKGKTDQQYHPRSYKSVNSNKV